MKQKVVKRNGEVVDFDGTRIQEAITAAFRASGTKKDDQQLERLTRHITAEIEERFLDFHPNVENIQDLVEKHLMKESLFDAAKSYILYRALRQKEREKSREKAIKKAKLGKLTVKKKDGSVSLFSRDKIGACIQRAAKGHEDEVDTHLIIDEVIKNVYDGITSDDIGKALVLATVAFIEKDPAYSTVAARLYLQQIHREVHGSSLSEDAFGMAYRKAFIAGIGKGVDSGMMDKRMLDFDLERLSRGLVPERDDLFRYIGVQTLYERYLMKIDDRRIELPQSFWMRVAMGLALNEEQKEEKALEFYRMLSSLRFVCSTPTLFHAGLSHPQLSSCYLTTIKDDLGHIFKCIGDNAQLSKWSGGLGNDWTPVRATGSRIRSTGVESQGVIPFLKIANDVTVAINRSGKRRGATCAYLETWHLDIEDFLDLRKNTGDDRRRTHDMNTANWIPDLFMKRVIDDEPFTLFSPEEVPDLHELYGRKFERRYREYEEMARNGRIRKHKVISAKKLWRKMLTRLFETGHPWMTFKDPSNIRSPQDHAGVVHCSNLCTEITLNTSEEETAVCNLGSINLAKHIKDGRLDEEKLAATVKAAMRMLDNVIDLNFYPTKEARHSNLRHRPVGLGIMGLQDAFYLQGMGFDSPSALSAAGHIMEFISYHALLASSDLAAERGAYESFKGSKWDRGLLPLDTVALLEEERGMKVEVDRTTTLDWEPVREAVRKQGMRNSNCMAIAPTATISTIAGCYPCIEPIYKNLYVKSNISGEFTIVNAHLIKELKELGLWNDGMLEQLKYYDGSIQLIASIPDRLKEKYKEVFEIDPELLIDMTAVRAKWIDQSQSHNVFMQGVSGKKLDSIYLKAWRSGLKTTYYLRTLAASQIEKSTLDAGKFGYTQKRIYEPGKGQEQGQEAGTEKRPLKKA
ncbi:MAG: ribonucleoside-diphosphate reductase subunit alpha, partial [DPANN group archaeon]|nr:ribonucleoside-diphosphate reductase subunit alpha [DPANN group archaeon]